MATTASFKSLVAPLCRVTYSIARYLHPQESNHVKFWSTTIKKAAPLNGDCFDLSLAESLSFDKSDRLLL